MGELSRIFGVERRIDRHQLQSCSIADRQPAITPFGKTAEGQVAPQKIGQGAADCLQLIDPIHQRRNRTQGVRLYMGGAGGG